MISIKTFTGEIFLTIYVTEDDTTYNDLLKYIKIPQHPRFETSNYEYNYYITVKPYIKFFHNTNEVKLNDIIDFNTELIIGFYFEYFVYNKKFGDNFNLPDTSTYNKCKALINKNPFNIIFISDEILSDKICKLAVQQDGYSVRYMDHQTEEICKLAVQQNGDSLRYVDHQTEEICKLAVHQNGYSLRYVIHQTEEICKLAVRQTGMSLAYVDHQTEEICKLTVYQNGLSLMYVKNQVEEICKLVAREDIKKSL
jgi:hypothetical protein